MEPQICFSDIIGFKYDIFVVYHKILSSQKSEIQVLLLAPIKSTIIGRRHKQVL